MILREKVYIQYFFFCKVNTISYRINKIGYLYDNNLMKSLFKKFKYEYLKYSLKILSV
jgi:hypothetical protein